MMPMAATAARIAKDFIVTGEVDEKETGAKSERCS